MARRFKIGDLVFIPRVGDYCKDLACIALEVDSYGHPTTVLTAKFEVWCTEYLGVYTATKMAAVNAALLAERDP